MSACDPLRPSGLVRRIVPTVALGAALAVLSPSVAPAQTVARRAQQTYDCVASNGQAVRNEPMGIGLTLNVPTSVAPGASLSLRGVIEVRVPDVYSESVSSFGVKWVDAVSDTFNSRITVGDRTFAHPADRWATGRQAARTPLVPSGPVTFPTLRIPEDARGAVTIRLPGNGFTRNPYSSTPPSVAFVARATVYWTTSWSFGWACYLESGEPSVLATIPIVAPGAAPPAAAAPGNGGSKATRTSASGSSRGGRERGSATTGGTSSTATAAPSTADDPFGGSQGAADDASGGATADAGTAATAGGGAPGAEAAGDGGSPAAASSGGGAATQLLPEQVAATDGVRLPATWLWLAGLVVLGLLAGWAGHLWHRVRLLERDGD